MIVYTEKKEYSMRQARILIASVVTLTLAVGAAAAQTYSTTASSIPSTTFASTLNSFVSSGYSTNGDIGAGCAYTRGAGDPGAVNDAQNNPWHLSTVGPVSIACFRATGNGSTNDTSAINTALASVSGNTVTINGVLSIGVSTGWGVTFGYSCSGANLSLDRDTEVLSAKGNGLALYGGVGGVFVNSAHIYGSGHGIYFGQKNSPGQSNREVFLNGGTDIDSNTGVGVYASPDSITRLSASGAWIVANAGGNVHVAGQLPNRIPVENGAIVQFSGGNIASSTGYGLEWQDAGTLQLDGVNVSYNGGDGVQIDSNNAVGDVTVSGSYIRGNGGHGSSGC